MDIIQLLEVLKPAKDVVTVQVVNQKDLLAPWIDLLKAVLPAAATAGVAWLAMNKSHRQSESNAKRQSEEFQSNAKRQSEEFKLGIEQQVKTLKIQTQLATEVDLKKETCKSVREACSHFLKSANQACIQSVAYKLAKDRDKLDDAYAAHDLFMAAMDEMATSKILLLSFLQPAKDTSFLLAINNVNNFIQEDHEKTGELISQCLAECREYILVKQQEIIELTISVAEPSAV